MKIQVTREYVHMSKSICSEVFFIVRRKRSSVVQRVKDLVLSLQQFRSLLWHKFSSWPGNFHMTGARLKKKKEEEEEK